MVHDSGLDVILALLVWYFCGYSFTVVGGSVFAFTLRNVVYPFCVLFSRIKDIVFVLNLC